MTEQHTTHTDLLMEAADTDLKRDYIEGRITLNKYLEREEQAHGRYALWFFDSMDEFLEGVKRKRGTIN